MQTKIGISILAEDCRMALKDVLDFVERHNKQDKEKGVAESAYFLEELLLEEK